MSNLEESGFGIFKTLTKSLRSGRSNRTLPVRVTPTIVGGDETQEKLLELLQHRKLSDAEKLASMVELNDNLKSFTISSVPEIWYQLKFLMNDDSNEIRHQSLVLFNTCVSLSDFAVPTKMSYYEDLINNCKEDDREVDLFLDVLIKLTKDGQDVYDLWIYPKRPLGKLLIGMLDVFQAKLLEKPQPQSANITIVKLVTFMSHILEFNYNIFEEQEISTILPLVLKIGNTTVEETTLAAILEFVGALVLYGSLPPENLYDVLEIMAGACIVPSKLHFDKVSMNILQDLLNSTNPALLINDLCDLLENSTSYGILRGTVRILERLVAMQAYTSFTVFFGRILDSLKVAVVRAPKLGTEIVGFLVKLFESENYKPTVTSQLILDGRSKIWGLLREVQGSQELFDLLQRFYEENASLSKDTLVDFFNECKLSESNSHFVFSFYENEMRCVEATCEDWYDHADALLTRYGGTMTRRRCLKTVVDGIVLSMSMGVMDENKVVKLFMKHFDVIFVQEELIKLWRVLSDSVFFSFMDQVFEKLYESEHSVEITKTLITTMLVLSENNNPKTRIFLPRFVNIAQHAITTHNWELYLTVSRILVRIRVGERGLFYTKPRDIEGLSETFGRNYLGKEPEDVPWRYPEEIQYIPVQYLDNRHFWFQSEDVPREMRMWFEVILDILTNFYDWEVYSFTWCHFCPQLANIDLFLESCQEQVSRLIALSCDNLQLKLPDLKLPQHIHKSNIQVAVVRTFSALLGYKSLLSRHEEDMIVASMISGLQSWEKAGIPCISFLTVACYEFPKSIRRYIAMILTSLQIRISSSFASPHILEFLNSLSQPSDLALDFTLDEFKRIFAIAFKYIQFSHDSNTKVASGAITTEMTVELSQFLTSLSYGIISRWFLKLSLEQRKELSSFIIRNLVLSSSSSEMDDQTLAYVDLIYKSTFSEFDFRSSKIERIELEDIETQRWIHGLGILTIKTHRYSGQSWISMRRPTGSVQFKVDFVKDPTSQTIFSPDFILLQLILPTSPRMTVRPIPLVSDAATMRSIGNFDRIPVVDFHKVGVIYIGPGQDNEVEMLSNRFGSERYHNFLNGLGDLVRLKTCQLPVGGLDTENDLDGKYAHVFSSPVVQMVFHTTTMMPNAAGDVRFDQKKRHVGNDYVVIYYNDSGREITEVELLKTQFNFINIIVEPSSSSHHKLKILRRDGLPPLFAISHFKIISDDKLSQMTNQFAILTSEFAQVWSSRGEYVSNWSHRVRQIKNILAKNSAGEGKPEIKLEEVLQSFDFSLFT